MSPMPHLIVHTSAPCRWLSTSSYTLRRHLQSRLLQPLKLIPPGAKESKSGSDGGSAKPRSKSAKLLADKGIIAPVSPAPGTFHILPLGQRALKKLTNLVDTAMEEIGAQRVSMPHLTPAQLWQTSGRRESMGPELMKFQDNNGREVVLGPTHEESVTAMMEAASLSHRQLPQRLYQISTKFRDELHPKWGLVRGREFLMKDLYTFDATPEAAEETYRIVGEAYASFFDRLGISYLRVKGDTGQMGGKLSHEYHYPVDAGQDHLLVCAKCSYGENTELRSGDGQPADRRTCPDCGADDVQVRRGTEVAHTFLLGDRYSSALKATFGGPNGKPQQFQMGCYGIGVSRLLAAATEAISTETQLRWPDSIAPFSACVIAPKAGSKEATAGAMQKAEEMYDGLNGLVFPDDVLLDDRPNITVGKKLREALATGHSYTILFGQESPDGRVELYDLSQSGCGGLVDVMDWDAAVDYLKQKAAARESARPA